MESDHVIEPKRKKHRFAASPLPPEVSAGERTALIDAYKTGLILAWKRDVARGYCLSLFGQQDQYVAVDQLMRYLEQLKRSK